MPDSVEISEEQMTKQVDYLDESIIGRTTMDKVSESETGQNQPKPDRQERDAAFSTGAGRKAVEKPKADRKCEDKPLEEKSEGLEAPVGLECETRGDDEAR